MDPLYKHAYVIYFNLHGCKNDYFQVKNLDIFSYFAQNKDCVYTLEPSQRGF